MSAIESRSQVRTVARAAAPSAATLAAGLMQAALERLSAAAKAAYAQAAHPEKLPVLCGEAMPGTIAAWKRPRKLPVPIADRLTPLERVRVSALAALSLSGCLVKDRHTVLRRLEALSEADTLETALHAREGLFRCLESNHQAVFGEALAAACTRAARKTGFGQVETRHSRAGELRVIATDPLGRSLVTEIRNVAGGQELETEVLRVTDGSCQEILDRFGEALADEGVSSAPPQRRSAGGVSDIAPTRQFLRRTAEALRRTRRLNQPARGRVR